MKLGDKIWIEGSTRATIESLEDGKVLLARLDSGGGWYRQSSHEKSAHYSSPHQVIFTYHDRHF